MLTVPEADRVSWEPVQYTVLTALSGYSRRVNPAVWISLCPLLSTMVLSPFLSTVTTVPSGNTVSSRPPLRRLTVPSGCTISVEPSGWYFSAQLKSALKDRPRARRPQ